MIQLTVSASVSNVVKWKGDILIVGACASDLEKDENGSFKNSTLKELDVFLKGILGSVIVEEDFKAKTGQAVVSRLPSGCGYTRIGLVAYQSSSQVSSPAKWKSFGESVVTATKNVQATSICITLANFGDILDVPLHVRAHSIAMGMSVLSVFSRNSCFVGRIRYKSSWFP